MASQAISRGFQAFQGRFIGYREDLGGFQGRFRESLEDTGGFKEFQRIYEDFECVSWALRKIFDYF